MKGRNIMSGILCFHEILHETKRRKEVGIILKLDLRRHMTKLTGNLLFECMEKRGFSQKWIN